MFCSYCGAELEEPVKFCPACGKSVEESVADSVPNPEPTPVTYIPTPTPTPVAERIPEEYQPLSPWAYFGLQILFAIPVVGFIFLIIFSINGANLNRRNFARSYWCSLIIVGVALLIVLLFAFLFTMNSSVCC